MNNNAGADFFGIDAKYFIKVQSQEIFYLVKYGRFSPEYVEKLPLEKRRYYFHKLVEDLNKDNKEPPPGAMSPSQIQKKSQK